MTRKLNQYELHTNKQHPNDMPFQIHAKNVQDARRQVERKRQKDEKIISLKRVRW